VISKFMKKIKNKKKKKKRNLAEIKTAYEA
jgi:hypothetical protein